MAMTPSQRSERYRQRKKDRAPLSLSAPADDIEAGGKSTEDPPITIAPDGSFSVSDDPPQPKARGRGRPPNSKNKPKTGAGTGAEEKPGEARAGASERPRRRKGGAFSDAEVQTLASRVHGMHQLIGALLQAPELIIEPREALALTRASIEVADQFNISGLLDSKWVTVLAFAGTAGMVYVPRLMAFQTRIRFETARARERADAAGTVDGQAVDTSPQVASGEHYNPSAGDGPNGAAGHA